MLSYEGKDDRRRHPRMSLALRASMDFGRNTPKHTCIIKNISEGGARLCVGLLLDPPARFTLKISSVGNFCRECQLGWRSEFDVGVEFIQRSARVTLVDGRNATVHP
jgi:hypothetical protein